MNLFTKQDILIKLNESSSNDSAIIESMLAIFGYIVIYDYNDKAVDIISTDKNND